MHLIVYIFIFVEYDVVLVFFIELPISSYGMRPWNTVVSAT